MIQKLHLGSTLAALLLFLLPWVDIQCSGQSLVTQSGLQTIYGGASVSDNLDAMSGGQASRPDSDESAGIAILVGLALVAIVAAAWFAFKNLRGADQASTDRVAILCVVALCLLLVQMAVGFPVKAEMRKGMSEVNEAQNSGDPSEQMGAGMAAAMMMNIQVRYLPPFYLELLALALPTAVFANNRIDRMKRPGTEPTPA